MKDINEAEIRKNREVITNINVRMIPTRAQIFGGVIYETYAYHAIV
jgi:hypothetical protein